VRGWLNVPMPVGEPKLQNSVGVELRGVRNAVLQVFVYRRENSIDADFPIVPAMMPGEIRARVAFPVATLLRDDDGGGLLVGREQRRGVAHASCNTQKHVG